MYSHNPLYSNKLYQHLLLLWLLLAIVSPAKSQQTSGKLSLLKNTLQADSLLKNTRKDSLRNTSSKKDEIDAQIAYNAQDSVVLLQNGTGLLYGKGDVKYKNITLKAEIIRVKMDSSTVFAKGRKDSLGVMIGEPVFSEGQSTYNSKELTYNLRTKKGYIRQAVTQQGEGYIISDKTKKTKDDLLCIVGGKYTTCDKHDDPDFYLALTRGKVKPGGYIVTGPAYLVVEDVPLPIAIPFGFFPFTDKYSSGIIMPTFQDDMNRGFGLTNGGYYFAINDYMDLELNSDIYTKGTWSVSATSKYLKRYKFNGNFSISYRQDVTGEKDLPNYSVAKNFSVRWSHTQDPKVNPNLTFSSSVNFSTSGYNRSDINSYYQPELNSENTKQSSVAVTQRFPNSPFNLSYNMLITQQTKDSTINLTLPSLNISMSRIYPFKRKNQVGKERWYEKISMSYTGTLANSIQTKEYKLLHSSLSRDWQNGMKHSIPISATFNLLKYINITPSVNYNERWYLQSTNQSWDKKNQKVVTDTVYGFRRVFDFNMGVSASTKLYGFYEPIRAIFGDKIDRIRHVLTPSVSLNYMPDFGDPLWGYYGTYVQSLQDRTNPAVFHDQIVQYSHYQGSLYGTPGTGKQGNISFSLANNVEMKVRNDNDTTGNEKFKKISLIDNFSVSGSYNMAADSMQWSVFSANLRLKLGKNYTLNLSGQFDPYMYGLNSSDTPVRINKLRWQNGGFPRFLGTSTSYSYTFSNDTFKKKSSTPAKKPDNSDVARTNTQTPNSPTSNSGESGQSGKGFETTQDGYQKITIPWHFTINYSVRYGNSSVFDKSKMEYNMEFTHNLSFTGDIALTNNWKISANSTYDFKAGQFTYTNLNVTRSLHCWTMTASIVPFGMFKSYTFHIGVNASMLKDLKYDKQSNYGSGSNNITWY